MIVRRLEVSGYRSIYDVRLSLGRVNVLLGPNGCGKTNLYRAMYLLREAAAGRFSRALAAEGGITSALWAGPRAKGAVRLRLAVELESLGYELECGLIPPTPLRGGSAFNLDPQVKAERAWLLEGQKRVELMKRAETTVWARDDEGSRKAFPFGISESESVLAELREPQRFPVLSALREEFLSWRFYHQFRTDSNSPLRQPQVGIRTPVLAQDGRDLAAALRTIMEIGDRQALDDAIAGAFPGAALSAEGGSSIPDAPSADRRFAFGLQMSEFVRPFAASELSDGTLHYLALLAALLSPRPPSLLALNEPETSMHPNLIEPLARLIARASRHSQIWVTTHSEPLAQAVGRLTSESSIRLEKSGGKTRLVADAEPDRDLEEG
jgi:predicted ATPase